MENWIWEAGSSKKIMQGIAKKLKNWEVFVAKKLIERDKREAMNYLCNDTGILRLWVRRWLKLVIYRTRWIPCQMQENFTILNQGAALEQPTFLINLLRFWVPGPCHAAILDCREIHRIVRYHGKRFWTPICSRRTTLNNLPQFNEFGIFFSGIGTWYYRNSKEREWNEKGIVEYVDLITLLLKWKWCVESYWWN